MHACVRRVFNVDDQSIGWRGETLHLTGHTKVQSMLAARICLKTNIYRQISQMDGLHIDELLNSSPGLSSLRLLNMS